MEWKEAVSGSPDSEGWDTPKYSSWSEQAPVGWAGQKLPAQEFSTGMAQEPIFGHSKQIIIVISPARCLKLIHLVLEICSAILNIQGNEGKI